MKSFVNIVIDMNNKLADTDIKLINNNLKKVVLKRIISKNHKNMAKQIKGLKSITPQIINDFCMASFVISSFTANSMPEDHVKIFISHGATPIVSRISMVPNEDSSYKKIEFTSYGNNIDIYFSLYKDKDKIESIEYSINLESIEKNEHDISIDNKDFIVENFIKLYSHDILINSMIIGLEDMMGLLIDKFNLKKV